jgi:hypothetical protein
MTFGDAVASLAIVVLGIIPPDAKGFIDNGTEAILIIQEGSDAQLPGVLDHAEIVSHSEIEPGCGLGIGLEFGKRGLPAVGVQEGENLLGLFLAAAA